MFFTYILHNSTINKYYIGHTKDLTKRLADHNSSHRVKFTRKQKGIWVLVYTEAYSTKSEAYRREVMIKGMKSKRFIEKLIEQSRL